MPPPLLFDLSKIDLQAEPIFDRQAIEAVNLQRYQMQQLDGIIWYDKGKKLILGYKDVTDKEFWITGHIPGRPLMPAVIMVESAAQLLSFFVRKIFGVEGFIGFLGIDDTKFRLPIVPGQRLYLLGHLIKIQTRKYTARVQGVVDGNMAFETTVSGMVV
jgi:3-hydroxyacyl-[acyl-carrier-protein] dehydratase